MKMKKEKIKVAYNRVREVLENQQMSQQELADRVGTNRAHISKIVNQKSPSISLPIAIKIAQELNTPVEQLFVL
jgi:transcriptional regulator with XRE-family HTH domain